MEMPFTPPFCGYPDKSQELRCGSPLRSPQFNGNCIRAGAPTTGVFCYKARCSWTKRIPINQEF